MIFLEYIVLVNYPLTLLIIAFLSYGAFPLHGTVRFGTARYGTAQFGSVCISTAVSYRYRVGGIIHASL